LATAIIKCGVIIIIIIIIIIDVKDPVVTWGTGEDGQSKY
jgi:hypothetical protein